MKVTAFHENADYTPILIDLIAKSATPLAVVETDFAADSSGFSTSKFERWYDEKYGVTKRTCAWVKVHVACGSNQHRDGRADSGKNVRDAPQFKPLLNQTAKSFTVKEFSADNAYASQANFEAVADVGGTLYAAFKTTTTGAIGGLFEKMFHYFRFSATSTRATTTSAATSKACSVRSSGSSAIRCDPRRTPR